MLNQFKPYQIRLLLVDLGSQCRRQDRKTFDFGETRVVGFLVVSARLFVSGDHDNGSRALRGRGRSKFLLRRNVAVRNVVVLAEHGEVRDDVDRRNIARENDQATIG